jgi:hypothetical protein
MSVLCLKEMLLKMGELLIACLNGTISIHDSILFDGNSASLGGAMNLEDTNLAISRNVLIPSK